MKFEYYDIESLSNVFTLCNNKPDENEIDIYYLTDDKTLVNYEKDDTTLKDVLEAYIKERNEGFTGNINLFDLSNIESNKHLAKTFGLSDAGRNVNDRTAINNYTNEYRIVCDTDDDYDESKHPYLVGYNSANYDTTMLALYLYETFRLYKTKYHSEVEIVPILANRMRRYNDELFSKTFINKMTLRLAVSNTNNGWSEPNYRALPYLIRKSMIMTGRYIDVAALNEKQKKLSLKRICGMLGYSINESDKLKNNSVIRTKQEFCELIAYNVSDTIKLQKLFTHPYYKAQFDLKRGLLKKYPELIYDKMPNKYAPNISSKTVRSDRLNIDSTSARFAAVSLCPYGSLKDIETVSFLYPHRDKAKELNIEQVNVLEESKKYFYENIFDETARKQFDTIYNFYKNIEGNNFNQSENYKKSYNRLDVKKISDIQVPNLCIPYFDKNGKPTSCYVNFSIGGIHGAEYNKELYDADVMLYEKAIKDMEYVKSIYPNPIDLKRAKIIQMSDGTEVSYKCFLKSGATLKKAEYKNIEGNKPVLFKLNEKGKYELNARYTYTSAAVTNHEDFESYYPNMLRMLKAFYNEGLGYDRYAEIFEEKQKYGKMMGDNSFIKEEQDMYSTLREGTKLVLNSASGAADATYDNPIRMNNMIISMRIIGQLFTWRIGQAQTLQGAKIVSTNTDGLFSVLEEKLNNKILKKESEDINVKIKPEITYLISKDSNNRLEMDVKTGKVLATGGETLGSYKGASPTKALSHPAAIDWALAEYLIVSSLKTKPNISLYDELDDETGMNIINSIRQKHKDVKGLLMFQNIISSSPGATTYIFGTTDESDKPIILQHYNRIFIMKDKTPNTMHLKAASARVITPAMKNKREKEGMAMQMHDPIALGVLWANGVQQNDISFNKEAIIKKVTNIESEWYVRIVNKDIYNLSQEEIEEIYDNLDYTKYLELLKNRYKKNWQNTRAFG